MMRSMTGYGRQEKTLEGFSLTLEMRSVNHRYLELGLRMPEEVRAIESRIREIVGKSVKRGKVDLSLKIQSGTSDVGKLAINNALASQLADAAADIAAATSLAGRVDPMRVLAWPGVVGSPEFDREALQQETLLLTEQVVTDFIASRESEGEKTHAMLVERVDAVEKIVQDVRGLRPDVLARQKEKLQQRLADIDVSIDQGRLEQELVYAAQRLDVDEELDRLDAHITEMRKIFTRKEPIGRRLDFLMQEFNREANTLSSKASDSDTTGFSVDLKVLIEQMREQIQNIE